MSAAKSAFWFRLFVARCGCGALTRCAKEDMEVLRGVAGGDDWIDSATAQFTMAQVAEESLTRGDHKEQHNKEGADFELDARVRHLVRLWCTFW